MEGSRGRTRPDSRDGVVEFVPEKPRKEFRRHVKTDLSEDEFEQVKAAAEYHDVTVKEFVRQALNFAIDNLGEKGDA